jgi:hypothetical protein
MLSGRTPSEVGALKPINSIHKLANRQIIKEPTYHKLSSQENTLPTSSTTENSIPSHHSKPTMSRYAAAHASLNGPGDARPTALQIVEDENLTNNLTDKVFLVTGVSSGIGIETLRAMYATGAHVIGTVRNMDKGKAVVEEIERNTSSKGKITLVLMDNASLESVRKAADEIRGLTDKLNVAIFNAGYVQPHTNQKRLLN